MAEADYGYLQMNIEVLLKEKKVSKNQICRDLDIPRTNFNRYCRGDFQRLDVVMICKLCCYLDTDLNSLLTYHKPGNQKDG